MCGRYAASASQDTLVETFEIVEVADGIPPAQYNIAPTDIVPAVVERIDKDSGATIRKLVPLRWGLVPSWSTSADGAAKLINARAETVATKPAFRTALSRRRCLLPADGFFEWYRYIRSDGKPAKQPYFIRPRDGGLLVMAGLYEFWKAPDGLWLTSCAIITTQATDAVGRLHDRMPMSIQPSLWDDWLDPHLASGAERLLSVPGPELVAYPVSTAVNQVAHDGPELIEPLRSE